MQIHADSKGKVALDESHYGPTVVQSVTEIPFHAFNSLDSALCKRG